MINSFRGRWFPLSNSYPVVIEYQGISYPTLFHYYIAMKIKAGQQIKGRYLSGVDCREWIARLELTDLLTLESRGTFLIRADWEQIKHSIMEWGLRAKFKNEGLLTQLLATQDEDLIFGNMDHDNYWGSCSCNKCRGGANHLGILLMKIRQEASTL